MGIYFFNSQSNTTYRYGDDWNNTVLYQGHPTFNNLIHTIMAFNSFFSGMKSYGKWDKTNSEPLTEEDKKTIDHAEVTEGEYGLSVCFFLVGTRRVKMCQLDDECQLPIGAKVDLDTVVFQHYTDGDQVSTRVVCDTI